MTWQDITIALVQIGFAGALLPAVRAVNKPPLATSIPTAAGMAVVAITMATLGLWFSTTTAAVGAVLWSVLAVQAIRRHEAAA